MAGTERRDPGMLDPPENIWPVLNFSLKGDRERGISAFVNSGLSPILASWDNLGYRPIALAKPTQARRM